MVQVVLCVVRFTLVGTVCTLPKPKDAAVLYEILPKAAKQFYDELTADEAWALNDMIKDFVRFTMRNPDTAMDKVLDRIQSILPSAYPKVTRLIEAINQQLEQLSPDAREFANFVLRSLKIAAFMYSDRSHASNQVIMRDLLMIYQRGIQLPQNVKDELKRVFPEPWSIFERDEIRQEIEKLIEAYGHQL